jgi:malate dehydrogenase (oxaloacetate-decarboxylating)(NADP+)
MAMEQEGMKTEEARNRIWLIDSQGLITTTRANNSDKHKMNYAKQAVNTKNLEEIVDFVKPSCIIGKHYMNQKLL